MQLSAQQFNPFQYMMQMQQFNPYMSGLGAFGYGMPSFSNYGSYGNYGLGSLFGGYYR